MTMHAKILIIFLMLGITGCGSQNKDSGTQSEVENFLEGYTAEFLALNYEDSKAEWQSNIEIIPGDTTNSYNQRVAKERLAAFTGNAETIERTQQLLESSGLTDLQIRQLQRILFLAADKPATVPELVEERIKMEAEQTDKLYGFDFTLDGKHLSTNDIDALLNDEADLSIRLAAWQASKEVGVSLKSGMPRLRDLRNQTVQALGHPDYFAYQVSEYGMTTEDMVRMCQGFVSDIWPLYRELHTWARYELAQQYGNQKVPDYLPAHWLPNRWGQDWAPLVEVEGMDLDGMLSQKEPEWLVRQAEQFYVSLGFSPLPESFYQKSSLYPLPPDAGYKKNNHASAWHMDFQQDIRCLMSVVPDSRWYETTHHELGHIYYYVSYTNPNVPPLLRRGANRAFHEAVGSLLGLAAMQKPFLGHIGLLPEEVGTDDRNSLLKEALGFIPFIPWSAGVMTMFEKNLYADNLDINQFNQTWWDLKLKYQGIVPPTERSEDYCDAASKTHITDDAAQYYDYALSYILLFQIHQHISNQILKQDPHETNYYGSQEVGDFLRTILEPGLTRDWRELVEEVTGSAIDARAMLEYFDPLMDYLREQNQGRSHTLPETI